MSGAVAHVERYKQGFFFSPDFVAENSWNGYERNCLFANLDGKEFADVGRSTGADALPDARGVAVADLNGDGALDLVINNNNHTPTIYVNRLEPRRWLAVDLEGAGANRDAVGATVRLDLGDRKLTRVVTAGTGYSSQSPFPVHFGLGDPDDGRVEALEITWPDGQTQRIPRSEIPELNQTLRLTQKPQRKS